MVGPSVTMRTRLTSAGRSCSILQATSHEWHPIQRSASWYRNLLWVLMDYPPYFTSWVATSSSCRNFSSHILASYCHNCQFLKPVLCINIGRKLHVILLLIYSEATTLVYLDRTKRVCSICMLQLIAVSIYCSMYFFMPYNTPNHPVLPISPLTGLMSAANMRPTTLIAAPIVKPRLTIPRSKPCELSPGTGERR